MTASVLRLATRTSPLAMYQAKLVVHALRERVPGVQVELVPMTSTGDRDARAFSDIGARGIFVRELERALLAREVDAAVHSCKDLTLELPADTALAALLQREDARDVLCGTDVRDVAELPAGARVATGSSRRAASLRLLRDDLQPVAIRGNVQTRLTRARERGDDACMLAAAGVLRLGLEDQVAVWLAPFECVPEAGQGAVAVQVRAGEESPWSLLDDPDTRWAVEIERRVAHALGGGCEQPVGVHVEVPARGLDVEPQGYVFVARDDGSDGRIDSAPLARALSVDDAAQLLLSVAAGGRAAAAGKAPS